MAKKYPHAVKRAAFSGEVAAAPEAAPSYYPVMGSFEVPETWDESYDVVVVGGGFAGLAASYAAAESGASVTLVEKLSTTGGFLRAGNMTILIIQIKECYKI